MRHEAVLIDMDKVARFDGNAGDRNLSAKVNERIHAMGRQDRSAEQREPLGNQMHVTNAAVGHTRHIARETVNVGHGLAKEAPAILHGIDILDYGKVWGRAANREG